jgi:tungstate transport system ATP-binding protein
MELQGGETVALYGPNGSGKSTFLVTLAGLSSPTEGSVELFGRNMYGSATENHRLRQRIALVHQRPFLFSTTVRKNVEYGLRMRHWKRRACRKKAMEAMEYLGIGALGNRHARKLSGGEKKLVAIARSLATDPEVLLLDEPTENLDRKNRGQVEALIKKLGKEGKYSILFSSHDFDQARRLSLDFLFVNDGLVVRSKTENLFAGILTRKDGISVLRTENGTELLADSDIEGEVHFYLEPEDILLSTQAVHSSARNCVPAKVVRCKDEGHRWRIWLDAGIELQAVITRESFAELAIETDRMLHVAFKASSLHIL